MKAKKLAIPVHEERISPLFDVARRFVFVNTETPDDRLFLDTSNLSGMSIIEKLEQEGASLVICSAISLVYERALKGRGIDLISGVVGLVDEIIDAYLNDKLSIDRFAMPGCACRKRSRMGRSQCSNYRDEYPNDKRRN